MVDIRAAQNKENCSRFSICPSARCACAAHENGNNLVFMVSYSMTWLGCAEIY